MKTPAPRPSPSHPAAAQSAPAADRELQSGPAAVPGSCAAQVLAVEGRWACLHFPASGETFWVDLAEVEFERAAG